MKAIYLTELTLFNFNVSGCTNLDWIITIQESSVIGTRGILFFHRLILTDVHVVGRQGRRHPFWEFLNVFNFANIVKKA